jgi:hypothetical protein
MQFHKKRKRCVRQGKDGEKQAGIAPRLLHGNLLDFMIVILVVGHHRQDHWIVPKVVTEAGLLPAAAVAAVIGVSAPAAPMVNW